MALVVLEGATAAASPRRRACCWSAWRRSWGRAARAREAFPCRDEARCASARAGGVPGGRARAAAPRARCTWCAANRREAEPALRVALARGGAVVADRYRASELAYLLAGAPAGEERERLAARGRRGRRPAGALRDGGAARGARRARAWPRAAARTPTTATRRCSSAWPPSSRSRPPRGARWRWTGARRRRHERVWRAVRPALEAALRRL